MNASVQKIEFSTSLFSVILGTSGLGYAWRNAAHLWHFSEWIGNCLLISAVAVWAILIAILLRQLIKNRDRLRQEFLSPIAGSMPALVGIATLVLVPAANIFSRDAAWVLAGLGLSWHMVFAIWHGGTLWKGGRSPHHASPALYLPSVAGNFTAAAALGTLGYVEWAYLFLGAGVFSWLAIESVVMSNGWQTGLPEEHRSLMGIQAAPPLVCAVSMLTLMPAGASKIPLMLWGYGLFQLAIGLRLHGWLKGQKFSPSYWAYTFGMTSALNCALKFAAAGVTPGETLALPLLIAVTMFVALLMIRSIAFFVNGSDLARCAS
ncbi:dicarboxylate transporter/tellurite-resistance protein TehA [Rugamonas sp.]|uniref:SLAC1 family transporter n=1 Tax=Rugamonas sp. TaxID=1926287 RepID=UPI0025D5C85D|nr:dicarboxylate transporter/tellurite-resistance protein TehA [Rugamonas sp.]